MSKVDLEFYSRTGLVTVPEEYWEGGHTYTVFGIEFNHGGGVKKTRMVERVMEMTTISWGFTKEPK